jgi:hypothetical protein
MPCLISLQHTNFVHSHSVSLEMCMHAVHVGVHECVKKQGLITPVPTLKNTYVYVLHFTVLLKTHTYCTSLHCPPQNTYVLHFTVLLETHTYTYCTSLSSSKHISTALHCPPQNTYVYVLHFIVFLKTHTYCTSLSSSKHIRIRTALHSPPQKTYE